jgi:hypothetical protein
MQHRVVDLCRNVLMTGEGLRPVLRYARRHHVTAIRVDISVVRPSHYAVTFYFDDHAQCVTTWADWRVLLDWLVERRSWAPDRIRFAHEGTYEQALEDPRLVAIRAKGIEVAGPPRLID